MSNIFRRSTQSKASRHSRRWTAADEAEDEEKALMRKLTGTDFETKRKKIHSNWSVIVDSKEDKSGKQRLGSILSVGANPVELLKSFKARHERDVYFWTPNSEWQDDFGCRNPSRLDKVREHYKTSCELNAQDAGVTSSADAGPSSATQYQTAGPSGGEYGGYGAESSMQGHVYEQLVYDHNDHEEAYAEFVGGAGERRVQGNPSGTMYNQTQYGEEDPQLSEAFDGMYIQDGGYGNAGHGQ